ncbi:hypothetical protein EZS27_020591 [termite gut metagenome]|uniref:Uncharacterized protein n=1 Tax=termite gut metagenome TaxID=433724 RepID=A0A5J4RAF6_9ZZZZ
MTYIYCTVKKLWCGIGVKNFLKLNYPPPKEVAFRSIYGYTTENSLNVKGKAGITLPPAKQVGF